MPTEARRLGMKCKMCGEEIHAEHEGFEGRVGQLIRVRFYGFGFTMTFAYAELLHMVEKHGYRPPSIFVFVILYGDATSSTFATEGPSFGETFSAEFGPWEEDIPVRFIEKLRALQDKAVESAVLGCRAADKHYA